jgi:hypothetical protein
MSRPASWRRVWPSAWLAVLLLGSGGLAHGAGAMDGQPCGQGGCSSGRFDPAVIREALRSADWNAPAVRTGGRTTALPAAAAPNAASAWESRLRGPGAREEYDCALSFGVGGTLGGDGFLATRALGRTRILRGK